MYNVGVTPAEQRAQARAQWTARILHGTDPGEETRQELSADEAWLAVGRLTRSLWELTGHSEVTKPRAEWPARLYHRGEARDDGSESP